MAKKQGYSPESRVIPLKAGSKSRVKKQGYSPKSRAIPLKAGLFP
jgi:hypothetical protein